MLWGTPMTQETSILWLFPLTNDPAIGVFLWFSYGFLWFGGTPFKRLRRERGNPHISGARPFGFLGSKDLSLQRHRALLTLDIIVEC